MKRILLIIPFLLLLSCVVEGQSIKRANPNHRAVVSAGGGTNIISNGTFDSSTDWTLSSQWTISTGSARYDNTGNGGLSQLAADMVVATEANHSYTIELDLTISSGNANFGIYDTSWGNTYKAKASYTQGHLTITFTTPANIGDGGISFYAFADSDNIFSFDNIEMYE